MRTHLCGKSIISFERIGGYLKNYYQHMKAQLRQQNTNLQKEDLISLTLPIPTQIEKDLSIISVMIMAGCHWRKIGFLW